MVRQTRWVTIALAAACCCLLTETSPAQPPAATLASPLDELDWLIGDWVAEADGTRIESTCDWDAGRRFLIRHIDVVRDGQKVHSVGQRIGFDAAAKAIKIWSFDIDGSHAEGTAQQDGQTWVFDTQGASRTGETWKSRNTYSAISRDGFTLTSESSQGSDKSKTSTIKFEPAAAIAAKADADARAELAADPKKQAILNSREWQEVRRSLQQWLSVQKIYSRSEVATMKAQIESKIASMSADELQQFVDDTRDKVKILLSPEGEDARAWLAQYMAVRTLSKEQWDKMRPDVVHMTAQQMQERLLQLNQQRAAQAQQSQAAAQGRDLQAQSIRQEIQYQRQSYENSMNRAYYDEYGSYRW